MAATSTPISQRKGPKQNRSRQKITELLHLAGISVNGNRPSDIQVHNEMVFSRILVDGALGLGESFMDGWWTCARVDEFFCKLITARLHMRIKSWKDYLAFIGVIVNHHRSESKAFEIGRHHYDTGNDLYRRMLDDRMIYSCGYWKNATDLNTAQEAKLDLVCKKLLLKPGMRVLDIGCGWGGAAKFAAERYQVEVVGVTVSIEQAKIGRETCKGLPIEIQLQDYQDIQGTFDRIFSLGMFEHVGFKNYSAYMQFVADHLRDNGLFLLHTIGANYSDKVGNAWVEKYIFPNSMLPSIAQIGAAAENKLVLEDWQNFGPDYDRTLMNWFENFDSQWTNLKTDYDQRFYRMWKYYLLSFAGSFRARENQLWQVVFSRNRIQQRYDAPR